jgi:small nuclear ribonucleoprotein D3
MSIGLPVKLLHEAQNHVITIEVKTGELYRGYLTEAEVIYLSEDSMNCRMDNVTVTLKDGKVSVLEQVRSI